MVLFLLGLPALLNFDLWSHTLQANPDKVRDCLCSKVPNLTIALQILNHGPLVPYWTAE